MPVNDANVFIQEKEYVFIERMVYGKPIQGR